MTNIKKKKKQHFQKKEEMIFSIEKDYYDWYIWVTDDIDTQTFRLEPSNVKSRCGFLGENELRGGQLQSYGVVSPLLHVKVAWQRFDGDKLHVSSPKL